MRFERVDAAARSEHRRTEHAPFCIDRPSPRLPHRRQHDIGGARARRLVAGRHDPVDLAERLELLSPQLAVASTSRSAAASFSGVQSSCRNSGTTFSPITRLARITEFTLIARRRIQASIGAGPVGRHHRHAGQCQFERHGAGFGQRRVRDPERGALLLLADHDLGLHRPALHRVHDRFLQMRHGRQHQFERHALLLQPRHRLAEHRHVVADFAAAASRQHQQHRRRLRRAARLPRRSAAARPVARSGDGRHSCRAARAACDRPRARTAAAPAHDRHISASRAPGRAATPRPRARHSRRSESRDPWRERAWRRDG